MKASDPSAFSEADIDAELRNSVMCIQAGKLRIFDVYRRKGTVKEALDQIRLEFGVGGHSHTFQDGGSGFIGYSREGMRLQRSQPKAEAIVSWAAVEQRISRLILDGRYLTPEELKQYENDHLDNVPEQGPEVSAPVHVLGGTPPIPATVPSREITQADIDAALQEWNGDMDSKRRVQQYMTDHARDRGTAEWLKSEYGDDLPAYPVNGVGAATDLPWTKVQRHLARLVKEDRFFTQEELDNFEDIDPAAIRERLEQDKPSAFVEQVMADVERIAEQEADEPVSAPPTVREIYDRYKPMMKELVLADVAYQNACRNSDRETAIFEGDAAVKRAALTITEPEFMRLYYDMPDFRYRLHREIVDETYPVLSQPQQEQAPEKTYPVGDTPVIFCEWSEHTAFEDEKIYSIYEFDRLMKQADDEYVAGKNAGMEKYGTWQKWYDSKDPELSQFLSYNKVKFTLVLPDGRTFTERQDVGDGDGGVLDFLGQYEKYRDIIPILQQAVEQEKERLGIMEAPDLSSQPITREGDTITIGDGDAAHEVDITVSDEEWQAIQQAVPERPVRDPLAPAYQVGDTVYLDKTAYEITDINLFDIQLRDPELPIPLLRAESKERFEAALWKDARNGHITEFLPANLERIHDYFREALTSGLLTDRDKELISNWLRSGLGNTPIGNRLSEQFANRAETIQLTTGETADYSTSTTGMEVKVHDTLSSGQYMGWALIPSILRALYQKELDGFSHEPVQRPVVRLDGKPAYQVGDKVVFPYSDRDISGTVGYIGEQAVRIDTGPYSWSHETINRDIFEEALRQDERNAGLFEPAMEPTGQTLPEESATTGRLLSDFSKGDRVRIHTVAIPRHSGYVGQTGTVQRVVKSTNMVWINLDNGGEYGSLPHNIDFEHPKSQEITVEANPVVVPEAPNLVQEAAERVPAIENFRIVDDNLGVGGPKEKYRMNVAAIRTLKQIEAEGRSATAEEQEILSRYVGWGGIPDAFDKDKTAWFNEYNELKELLTDEEYKSARASTLNAHYTSPTVIKAIYEAISNMGFETGNILEPSCGIGNFFGLLPESMAASKLYGVELDSITGRIAQQLYPQARITVRGYEKTGYPKDFFDLAVGNVPFGQHQVNDPDYNKLRFSIHNYFFAKALDQVRPGGVIAFITSRYTMDANNPAARQYLAKRADLLGAIRLPNNAFKANAGTDVVSDILFFQKREAPAIEEPAWVQLGENEDGFSINRYFIDHPEMILGRQTSESTQYGRQDFTVAPIDGLELADQLHDAIKYIHGQFPVKEVTELGEETVEDTSIPADPNVQNYSYTIVGGEVYYRENSIMVKPELNEPTKARIMGMVELRDCVRRLIDLQMADVEESEIEQERQTLNALYDAYTEKYGLINNRENALAFSEDNAYYLLCSLEVLDDDGNLKRKADVFTKRTINPHHVVTSVDTASEALAVSIGEHACVDLPYMAQLTGKTEDELEQELTGVLFRDIQCAEQPENIKSTDLKQFPVVAADEYLSGNVRQKLRMAKAMYAALPDESKHLARSNVEALEAAQPKDLEASEIDLRLGATWLDQKYVQQFMYELFKTPRENRKDMVVKYSTFTGEWNISGKNSTGSLDVMANSTYGTDRINAYHILEDTLNLRDVRIYDTILEPDGKERRVLNQNATTLAAQKQQLIKDAFRDWIWKDPQRRQDLVRQYNELFNSIRPREYDGRHIVFGGMNPEITLREHQLNAIAHVLYGNNVLLAHEVGAGKTFEMAAAAMESKRLGLCNKSLFAVPNHLIGQWASEFLRLYPSANILVTSEKDFEAANRKKFCSRIATGNYDAVIMGHSQFELLPVSYARREALLQDQIMEIEEGIEELEDDEDERFSVKQLERTKRSLEARLEKLQNSGKKDGAVTFEQLGVDRLFVDEAHSYKNLFLYTKMRNVAGLSTADAQKSSDMLLKCRYMDEITGGRGTVFATGTPVSNSMTELFTMQRYLQQALLEKGFVDSKGRRHSLTHFDSWASIFGETVTKVELGPEGKYRPRTRFARFFNLPELMAMFRETADIKTADQLNLPVPKAEYHTEKALPSEIQKELVEELSVRASNIHAGRVNPKIDNMLKITSDGRKLGLDQRLINPNFPDDPGSKVNMCVQNVFRIWQDGQADKLTQIIFCDLSTPKAAAAARKDKTAMAAGDKSACGTELHALGNLLDDIKPDPPFSIYEDIRKKLIAMGIPAREIAFIHNANSDAKRKKLFGKVRSGQVRVLMGSTFKMGAGMNVQDRLVALHDLDCPWRPGDLEQRKGRIVRQGNQNNTVHIYRYVTEGTFDSYLWQTVENKQKFISQIMSSKSPVRSCEDVDETTLSYAEIKALCAGNPLIREKMDLDIDVSRLRLLKADHQNQQYRMEDDLFRRFPTRIQEAEGFITGLEADMKTLAEHPHPMVPVKSAAPSQADGEQPDAPAADAPAATDVEVVAVEDAAVEVKQGFAGMEIGGQTFTDKVEAGKALIAEIHKGIKPGESVGIGAYRGFSMALSVEDFGRTFVLTLKGQMTHRAELGEDVLGNFLRIDHALNKMPERVASLRNQVDNLRQQMETIRGEVGKPFLQEQELQQKSARLAELNTMLGAEETPAPAGEQIVAKSARPSLLEGLKRPSQPGPERKTPKPPNQER